MAATTETVLAEGMNAFLTRGPANDGIELPLYTPDGNKSEHWVRILGVDSDKFRTADAASKREMIKAVGENMGKDFDLNQAVNDIKRRLIATLVIAWSFPQECTPENVEAFFKEAPQIMDSIDQAAGKRALFFQARSSS
jgi:hypothetical protein